MYNGKKILAIIPARGGSKGIKNKNIIDICGKPLIAYSIEEALKCSYIDNVVVSTDSEIIKRTAEKYGAEVPFLRPAKLSGDSAKSIDVMLHCVEHLKNKGYEYDYTVLLQPTSPLRKVKHIEEAIIRIVHNEENSLISVCEVEQNPVLMRTIENDRLKEIISVEQDNLRRQDLPKYYIFNGAIYINKVSMLEEEKSVIDNDTIPYIMEKKYSIDIDEPLDIIIAESIIKGDLL